MLPYDATFAPASPSGRASATPRRPTSASRSATSTPVPTAASATTSVATDPTACYDTFGVELTKLDTTWPQYQIPFAGLAQRNFGLQRPALDTSAHLHHRLQLQPGEIFDLWVDDIAFY